MLVFGSYNEHINELSFILRCIKPMTRQMQRVATIEIPGGGGGGGGLKLPH